MNNGKQLIIAVAILGALIAATLLLRRDPFENKSKPDYSTLLARRSEGSIDKIVVRKNEAPLTVEKRGDAWWITEPRELPADEGTVKDAAGFLEKMTITDMASKKKERHSEYGLGKDSPDYVEIKAFSKGSEVLSFAGGKPTPDYQGNFILLASDQETVYKTDKAIPYVFGKEIKDWRSKVVLQIPREDFERIRLTNAGGTLELEKDSEGNWRRKDASDWFADKNRLGSLMVSLGRLQWVDVVDEPDAGVDYGFQSPQAGIVVTAAGKQHTLVVGKELEEPKGNTWVRLEGDPRVYQVRKPQVDRLTKEFDFYKGEAPQPRQESMPEIKVEPPGEASGAGDVSTAAPQTELK